MALEGYKRGLVGLIWFVDGLVNAPHPELLDEPTLKAWLKFNRRADLEKYLRSRGVPILYGRGGAICTTLRAINQALRVDGIEQRVNNIEFE